MRFTPPTRRLAALVQILGVLASLTVGLQVSQCPPGMDMGMDMSMSEGEGHSNPMECPFRGPSDEHGDMSCPLAVGGLGPCGTGSVAPSELVVRLSLGSATAHAEAPRDSSHADGFRTIELPPPRA